MIRKIIVIAVFLIILFSLFIMNNKEEPMINPAVAPQPSPQINQPEEIKYDSSTDLKKELESVNPEVLDSDFSF